MQIIVCCQLYCFGLRQGMHAPHTVLQTVTQGRSVPIAQPWVIANLGLS